MDGLIVFLTDLFTKVPGWVDAGMRVEALVEGAIKAVRNLGTTVSPDNEAFKALDVVASAYDNDFDVAAAARIGEPPA